MEDSLIKSTRVDFIKLIEASYTLMILRKSMKSPTTGMIPSRPHHSHHHNNSQQHTSSHTTNTNVVVRRDSNNNHVYHATIPLSNIIYASNNNNDNNNDMIITNSNNNGDDLVEFKSDKDVLAYLYNHCGGKGWKKNYNWLQPGTEPRDSWFGITIDGRNKKVTRIQLFNDNLRNSIPECIGRLSYLKELSLFKNNLTGPLPKDLSRCKNLETINLIGNNLEGEIPCEYGYLSKLQRLYLSQNNLSGNIPESLSGCILLTNINVSDNPKMKGIISMKITMKMKELIIYNTYLTCEDKVIDNRMGYDNFNNDYSSRQAHHYVDSARRPTHHPQYYKHPHPHPYQYNSLKRKAGDEGLYNNDIRGNHRDMMKRTRLTNNDKVKLIKEVNKKEQTHKEIAKKFGINERTLRRYVKDQKDIFLNAGKSDRRTRKQSAKYKELQEHMNAFVIQEDDAGRKDKITKEMLIDKAKEWIPQEMDKNGKEEMYKDFKHSNGWVVKFMQRNTILNPPLSQPEHHTQTQTFNQILPLSPLNSADSLISYKLKHNLKVLLNDKPFGEEFDEFETDIELYRIVTALSIQLKNKLKNRK